MNSIGTYHDWTVVKMRNTELSFEQKQMVWHGSYLRWCQYFALQIYVDEKCNQNIIESQFLLLDEEWTIYRTFYFDAQLNAYTSYENTRTNRRQTAPLRQTRLMNSLGMEKNLVVQRRAQLTLVFYLERLVHLHTLLATPTPSALLLPILDELVNTILNLWDYLTRMILLMLAMSTQPLTGRDGIGRDLLPHQHVFFDSLFQAMAVFLMQCPCGLLDAMHWVRERWTGSVLKPTEYAIAPEFLCGLVFPNLFAYHGKSSLYFTHLQNLTLFHRRTPTGRDANLYELDYLNMNAVESDWHSNYIFCTPSRLYHGTTWEPVPNDKLCILMTKIRVWNHPKSYSSLGIANHYYSMRTNPSVQNQQDFYWTFYDFKGNPINQHHKSYPVYPITTPQNIPQQVYDLTQTPHQVVMQTGPYCIDHRMVNKVVLLMNDFYSQKNESWYKHHCSFIFPREFLHLAGCRNTYHDLMNWYDMCLMVPHLPNEFLNKLCSKMYSVYWVHTPGCSNKITTTLQAIQDVSTQSALYAYLHEHLYQEMKMMINKYFKHLFNPLQRTPTSRLRALLQTQAFRDWFQEPMHRHDHELKFLSSI